MQPTQTHHQGPPWRRRIAIGAAVFAPLVFAACGSSSASKSQPAAKPSASAKPAANVVQIKLIAYRPAKLSVATGTTVTWTQMDPGVHTVTSGTVTQGAAGVSVKPDGTFDSGELPTGKKFTHTFAATGTYTYFCQIHPATMRGEITVK